MRLRRLYSSAFALRFFVLRRFMAQMVKPVQIPMMRITAIFDK